MSNIKKINLLMITLIMLSLLSCGPCDSCDSNVDNEPQVVEPLKKGVSFKTDMNYIDYHEIEYSNMKYGLYREYDGALAIVNITRDSLEVELLKKRLNDNTSDTNAVDDYSDYSKW